VPRNGKRANAAFAAAPVLLSGMVLFALDRPAWGQGISLQTATGGVTFSGSNHNYNSGFGNVNGLGVGTPSAGLTVISAGVTGGVLYATPYNIVITGAGGGNPAAVSVYVRTNFSKSSTLVLKSCYPNASCTSAASYTTISTDSASPTVVIPAPGIGSNGTVVASLALFVSNANGSSVTGSDSATLYFLVYDGSKAQLKETDILTLNSPDENVQWALQLTLATAGGLTISAASDYSANFGVVNGIGINPPGGLSVVSAAGGVIYSTPYYLQPVFSNFSSTTGTVSVYVSSSFGHPSVLVLKDAAASGGPYSDISTTSSPQTTLTTSASSGTNLTRYLGLFVSILSGAGSFTGADNATLTYTLMVP